MAWALHVNHAKPISRARLVALQATSIKHVGKCDNASYPMAGKKMSMEYLREKGHLRSRTNTIGAVARIRNALAYATHTFFRVRPPFPFLPSNLESNLPI